MFKYLRTMNNGSASPEILEIKTSNANTFREGSICTTSEYGFLENTLTEGAPKYLVLENKTASDGKVKIRCMKILPGMLFEADGGSNPDNFNIGMRGCISQDSLKQNALFCESGTDLEIIAYPVCDNVDKLIVTVL